MTTPEELDEAFERGYNYGYEQAQKSSLSALMDCYPSQDPEELCRFYNVESQEDLISMQSHHVTKLQERVKELEKTTAPIITRVCEG